MGYAELLDNPTGRVPHKIALIDSGQCWSYCRFNAMTKRVATGLAAADVQAGDRVVLQMLNCAKLAILYFACVRMAAVVVPVDTRLKAPGAEFVLRHCGGAAYVDDATLLPSTLHAPKQWGRVRQVFVLSGTPRITATRSHVDLATARPMSTLDHTLRL